jgi:hypothetical protein
MGFEEINSGLESEGKWRLLEKKGHQSFTRKEQDVIHDTWIYEVM